MTDWQSHYERNETPWDRGGPSPALVDWLAEHRMSGRVLVPGCGHGHDLAALAGSGAGEVHGLDIAPGAVALAQERRRACPVWWWNWVIFSHCRTRRLRAAASGCSNTRASAPFPANAATTMCVLRPTRCGPAGVTAVFYLRPWDEGEDRGAGAAVSQ